MIFKYKRWLKLREQSKDEHNEKLCYCGHTFKCSCADPDKTLFNESVKNGTIKLGDIDNGWNNKKKMEKVVIGESDYTRKQMEDGDTSWAIGSSGREYLETIKWYEEHGFRVEFETNIFRRIFAIGIYKVVAYKDSPFN